MTVPRASAIRVLPFFESDMAAGPAQMLLSPARRLRLLADLFAILVHLDDEGAARCRSRRRC